MVKYKRCLLFALIFLSMTGINKAQFLHIGARGFFTPITLMDYYEYDVTDYVYYFSNERNETLYFSGFEFSTIKSFVPSPSLYLRYDLGNHFFFQTDFFTMRFTNEALYENSVDYGDFVQEFDPHGDYQDLEYNKINLRWRFTGNSLTVGYNLMKAKTIRPFVYIGIQSMYLTNFEHRTLIDQTRTELDSGYTSAIRIYNDIAFKNLDTFKEVTFHYRFGWGFKYHGISFDFFTTTSMPGKNIDIYGDKYVDEASYDGDITLSERANYKSMYTFNTSLSINIFSFNLSKKQIEY